MRLLTLLTPFALSFSFFTTSIAQGQTSRPDLGPKANNPSDFLLPNIFHINSIRATRFRQLGLSNILVEFRRVHQDPWDENEEREFGRRTGSVPSVKVHCEIEWKGSFWPKSNSYTDCVSDRLLSFDETSPSSIFKLRISEFSSLKNFKLEVQEVRNGVTSKTFATSVRHMKSVASLGDTNLVFQTEDVVPQLRESDWDL